MEVYPKIMELAGAKPPPDPRMGSQGSWASAVPTQQYCGRQLKPHMRAPCNRRPDHQLSARFSMSATKPLDYVGAGLQRDGEAVDGFRVGCLVAEEALKVSLRPSVGTTGLNTRLLSQTVKMKLDGYSREQYVMVHEPDRELAVRIAKRARVEVHRLGFEVKGAVVSGSSGAPGEEHDMELHMVDAPDDSDPAMKRVSCELTCRRMRSNTGLADVRKKLQTERVDHCGWWQREVCSGQWEGRLVVLCNFPSGASGTFDVYADYTPVGGKPRGVLNWPYARRNFGTGNVVRPPPRAAMSSAKAKARSAPARVVAPVRRKQKDPFPRLQFRRWKGRNVAPIKPVLKAAKADTDHIGKRYQRWASSVPNGFADRTPRNASKKGGKAEYVATETVLRWIYEHEGA